MDNIVRLLIVPRGIWVEPIMTVDVSWGTTCCRKQEENHPEHRNREIHERTGLPDVVPTILTAVFPPSYEYSITGSSYFVYLIHLCIICLESGGKCRIFDDTLMVVRILLFFLFNTNLMFVASS